MTAPLRVVVTASVVLIPLMTLTPLGPSAHAWIVDALGGPIDPWHVAVLLNILLFVPVGMVIGWIDRPSLLPVAMLASVAIELTQLLLSSRNAAVIDVVANTVGAVLGFVVLRLWMRVMQTEDDARGKLPASPGEGQR
jgi:glycopeptide antibiotics resistance protein